MTWAKVREINLNTKILAVSQVNFELERVKGGWHEINRRSANYSDQKGELSTSVLYRQLNFVSLL